MTVVLKEPEEVFISEDVKALFVLRVDVRCCDEKVMIDHRFLRRQATLSFEKLREKRSHHHLRPLLRSEQVDQIHENHLREHVEVEKVLQHRANSLL